MSMEPNDNEVSKDLDPITGFPKYHPPPRRFSLPGNLNSFRIIVLLIVVILLGRYLFGMMGLTEKDRVLQTIDRATEAVQKTSMLKLREIISKDYKDGSGKDRSQILTMAQLYFRGNASVEIIRMDSSVQFPEKDTAQVDLRVQVIGLEDGRLSHGLTNDSILGEKYELLLKKEDGDWKITSVNPESGKWRTP